MKQLPRELKTLLAEYSVPILEHYSKELGIGYKKLIIRKTKSKRGSCTSEQEISLNLSLVHLPTKFIKYVIIHEACHLKIKDHSKRFRALVEKYCPDCKKIKKEMKDIILK
jgi:predicted metal-dependent hydrolase